MSWQEVALGDLASVESGGGAPQDPSAFGNEGLPFFRAGSLPKLLSGASEDELEKIHPEVAKRFKLKAFPAGTLLFAKSGMSATKGHIYRMRQPGYVVNHLAALVPSDEPTGQYLAHVLAYRSPVNLIQDAAYPSIRLSDISRFTIPAPKNARERERIAAILDKADALRKQRRRAIALLDSLTQSIFLEMFGDFEVQQIFPSELLGNLTTKIGSGATPKGGESSYQRHGVPFIRSMNVHDGVFEKKGLAHIDDQQAEALSNVEVKIGDVFLNITGASVARVCLAPDNMAGARVNQHVMIIRPGNRLLAAYLEAYLLQPSVKRKLLKIGEMGATRQAITKSEVEKFPVVVPPIQEQIRFENVIKKILSMRKKMLSSQSIFEEAFSSLQHRAFSGQL